MTLELYVADAIDDYKMKMNAMRLKMDAMRLKLKKVRKYAIANEAWYPYVVGSIVTLVAIFITFVVMRVSFLQSFALKMDTQLIFLLNGIIT